MMQRLVCALALFLSGYVLADTVPDPAVHAFYYTWYANPETDGRWAHWNHFVMLKEGQGPDYSPPESIGANFYPANGLYSSNSIDDTRVHLRQLKQAGVGTVAATWWGPGDFTDRALDTLFAAAQEEGVKVCFHIEPFGGRTGATSKEALVCLLDKYDEHPALYRSPAFGNRPMAYMYDSYLVQPEDWATILDPAAENTIRGTKYDTAMIGLWVKGMDGARLKAGGFDGAYTYFATDGFTYGSTIGNWPKMAAWCRENGLAFLPSVGPGYDDTRIRPWNTKNQRDREDGAYYDRMWEAAIAVKPEVVSITSFNEWHEGTQIEPAVPKEIEGYTYLDYGARPPEYYLDRTRHWVEKLHASSGTAADAVPQKSLPLPGEVFRVEGRAAFVILPPFPPTDRPVPWVWYAPTLPSYPDDHERWMFERFLAGGSAIAGIDAGESYGSPEGCAIFSALYEELTKNRGFSPTPVLLGRSRGGLMTLSWAAGNPEKVAGFAGIYPVCNLVSYPGLENACGAFHLSAEALAARLSEFNPIDRLEPLAKAGIPLFAIHGDSDTTVPLEANSGEMRRRYEALGGKMELIIAPGQGHNVWSGFFESEALVDFVLRQQKQAN